MKKQNKETLSDAQIEILRSIPELSFSKATTRQIEIIEAAIHCYASFGFDETTYEKIAKQAKLSRPLLFHYFEDKVQIFDSCIKYVRALYHQLLVEGITKGRTGKERFEKYLEFSFELVKRNPNHIKFWFIVYHSASTNMKYKKMNSDLVALGVSRISALIKGIESNHKMSDAQAAEKARIVQALITGGLVQFSTETSDIIPKDYIQFLCREAMSIAVRPK